MNLLFRYLFGEYVKVFAMCFAGLMTVYLVVDFFEKVRKFVRQDVDLFTILWYFLLRTPGISFQIAPLAVLMATLLTLGLFSRTHEITAMRSCGISLYRIAAPFLTFALAVALALFGLSAVVAPVATAHADYVKTVMIEKKPASAAFKGDRQWVQIGNRSLMNIEVVEPDGDTLRGISLYRLDPDFGLAEIIEASQARYTPAGWILVDGVQRTFLLAKGPVKEEFKNRPIALSQTPKDFSTLISAESEEMTLSDMRSYAKRLRKDGYSVSRVMTDYHARVAFPFVSVVMVVVGIALSLRRSGVRGSGMAVGIGQALVIGFLYWATHSVAVAVGRAGNADLPPLLAGWMANLVFLSLGCYLFLKVRQ